MELLKTECPQSLEHLCSLVLSRRECCSIQARPVVGSVTTFQGSRPEHKQTQHIRAQSVLLQSCEYKQTRQWQRHAQPNYFPDHSRAVTNVHLDEDAQLSNRHLCLSSSYPCSMTSPHFQAVRSANLHTHSLLHS